MRSLLVSHDVIGYHPGRHPAIIRVPGDGSVGRVLRHILLSVFAQLDRINKADAVLLARGLIGLLRGVLLTDAGKASVSPGFAAARGRAMRDHIEQHLRSDALSADAICACFNISRATLYRDFKDGGGLERYILDRKLNAALMALAFGAEERGNVTRAAEHWGFSSTSYFSRQFRRKFGFGPSDVIGQGRRRDAAGMGDAAWHDDGDGQDILSFLQKL